VARRSCLPGLRRGGGGRLAGAAVLSCLAWPGELTAEQVLSASECVRRSHCATGRTPTQTRHGHANKQVSLQVFVKARSQQINRGELNRTEVLS